MTSDPQAYDPAPPIAIYMILLLDLLPAKRMQKLMGKYDPRGKQTTVDSSKRRGNTGSKKCGCQMRVVLLKDRASEQWEVRVLEAAHNHAASIAFTAHPAHRIASIPAETRATISSLAKAGLPNAQILSALRESSSSSTPLLSKDISKRGPAMHCT
ncbi:uncharacterized protein RSE6_09520 [Rhynchosporium secalis]|uniref:FAR1 domain-containing protein n=1 Tax=Rhynchosporium secalis TaxID=38038 RepID=A0A1E1MI56_RHYSE|nr:uncharacterized protein RSE6_09520 [Rhynchosporium secalis]